MRTFDYLVRHSNWLTTAALLVGLAAGAVGSMDSAITKLLAVHLPSLQPPLSADLEVDARLKVAALMGVGLLYAGTQHSRMSTGKAACRCCEWLTFWQCCWPSFVVAAQQKGTVRNCVAHVCVCVCVCACVCFFDLYEQGGQQVWHWGG